MKPLYIILALCVGMYIGMLFESNQVKAVAPEPVQPDFELRLQSDRGFSTKAVRVCTQWTRSRTRSDPPTVAQW
jgi:hypothetical protein